MFRNSKSNLPVSTVVGCLLLSVASALPARATTYWLSKSGVYCADASMWKDEKGVASGNSGEALSPSHEYVVNGGKTLTMKGTCSAGSMKAGVVGQKNQSCVLSCNANVSFGNDGLFLCQGWMVRNGSTVSVNGHISVMSAEDRPFGVYGGKGAATSLGIKFNSSSGTLSSDENAALIVGGYYDDSGVFCFAGDQGFYLQVNNFVGYEGTIIVTSQYDNAVCADAGSYGAALSLNAGGSFPGRIRLCGGGALELLSAQEVTVGDLRLEPGAEIWTAVDVNASTCRSIKAVDLSVAGPVYVTASYSQTWSTDGLVKRCRFLTGPKGKLKSEDFVFVPLASRESASDTVVPQRAHFEVDPDEDADVMYLVVDPIVRQTVADSNDRQYKDSYVSSIVTATSWSDLAVPHEGCHYWTDKHLRTDSASTDIVFPGLSFTQDGTGRFVLGGARTVTISDFVWRGGELCTMNGASIVLEGRVRMVNTGKAHQVLSWNSRPIEIRSELSGSGLLTCHNCDTASCMGNISILGLNTNFYGTVKVQNEYTGTGIGIGTKCVSLSVRDGRNLGGVLDAPDFKALELTGYSRLVALGNVTLDRASNRGLFVNGDGTLYAQPDCTLKVDWPITVYGTLHKSGAGVLELGGPMKFYDAATSSSVDSVRADPDVLDVYSGTLKIASAKACDGVRIDVTRDGAIVLPISSDDAELARYGLYNVKAGAVPFGWDPAQGTLPISFEPDASGTVANEAVTNALVTVADAAAAGVRAMRLHAGKLARRIEYPADVAGATTFAYETKPRGFIVILR